MLQEAEEALQRSLAFPPCPMLLETRSLPSLPVPNRTRRCQTICRNQNQFAVEKLQITPLRLRLVHITEKKQAVMGTGVKNNDRGAEMCIN